MDRINVGSGRGFRRREVLLGLAGSAGTLALGGCGTSPTLDILGTAVTSLGEIGKPAAYGLSAAQIDALPYASLGLRVGKGAPAIMILASIDGDELHWASGDGVVFVTKRGGLVKTVGLPRDLSSTQWAAADPLASYPLLPVVSRERSIYRFIDLRPNDDFSVPVESTFETKGDETISILGRSHSCMLVSEHVRVRKWRWSTDNLFWIDKESGRVWRSRQQFSPDTPTLTLELLKPAAEPSRST